MRVNKLHSGLTLVGTVLSPAARTSGCDYDSVASLTMWLSEGLSQATLVMIGARPGGTGTIPLIATIHRRSKLCYLFYYNVTSNYYVITVADRLCLLLFSLSTIRNYIL